MAVTITIADLIADLRLADTPAQQALAQRRLDYSTVAVTKYAPAAPDTVHNEAVSRLAAYLFDQPTVAGGAAFANALRNSGASNILLPYRVHSLGFSETVDAVNQAIGSVGNPVTGLAILGDQLTVTFADGSEQVLTLPAGTGGNFNVDQSARDDAQAALDRANVGVADAAVAKDVADLASTAAAENAATVAGLAVPFDWASLGNTDVIPLAKFGNNIRGHRVYISTATPPHGQIGDVWIFDSRNTNPQLYEYTAIGWQLDYTFYGGRIHYTTTAHDVAMDSPDANRDDLLLELIAGTLTIYRRLFASTAPFWESLGTVAGGGGGGGDVAALVAAWALQGNMDNIPSSKLPFDIPTWLSDTAEVLPDSKLPVARFVPDASGATDGQVAKVAGGAWVIGDDLMGSGGGDVTAATYVRIAAPVSYGTDNSASLLSVNWREYEMLVGVFKRTQDSVDYPFTFLTHTLEHEAEIEVPLEQNARIQVFRVANSDTLTFGNLSGITGSPTASDTIEVWGYNPPFRSTAGSGGLSAAGVTGLDQASNDEVHSNALFPGVFGGALRKYSFGNLIALMRSTVGLGRRINPGGSTGNLGKVPVLHEDGADFHYQLQKPG